MLPRSWSALLLVLLILQFTQSRSFISLRSFIRGGNKTNLDHRQECDHFQYTSSSVTPLAASYPRRSSGMGNDNRSTRRPSQNFQMPKGTITNMLIALNLLAYLATSMQPALKSRFMKINNQIAYGQTYRLFTSLFLHASPQHLLMNCYSLYSIGPMAEQIFGTVRFGSTYVAAGAIANIATFLAQQSPYSLGASGCISGIIGALGMHYYRNKSILGFRAESGLESIKRTILLNIMYGFSMQGIDNHAHLAGLVGGGLVSYLFGPRLQVIPGPSGGRLRVIDKPMINYIPLWRKFLGIGFGNDGPSDSDAQKGKNFRPRGSPLPE